ncbi:MAG: hypothetical protein Q4B14_03275, partial [Clostridia bacterium]|nr:hypothetical protein [Clostridia bacterium]
VTAELENEGVMNDIEIVDTLNFSMDSKASLLSDNGGSFDVALVRSKTLSTEEIIEKMESLDNVEFAEPNYTD